MKLIGEEKMKRTFVLILVLLISVSLITGCGKSTSTLESEIKSVLDSIIDAVPESTTESASEPKEQNDTNNAPPAGGSGITTNALINEIWDWMGTMSYTEKTKITYEQITERLGDEGELQDTYDDKVVYRWEDPNGGVMLVTFKLAENGLYC